jgi:photosystem II stability/assembly factor-like uncharacterized protein
LVRLALALTVVSLSAAACTTNGGTPTATPTTVAVLGQHAGTTVALGQPAPTGTGELGAVSCADAQHCWAVGVAASTASGTTTAPPPVTVIAATADGGLHWAAQRLTLAVTPDLTGVSCPTLGRCMAVGSTGSNPPTGTVLTTRNGGRTWTAAGTPAGALAVIGVVCTTSTNCTVLVSDGTTLWSDTSLNFGTGWTQKGNLPAGLQDARDLSCTLSGTCLVVGNTPTTTGHGQGAVVISVDAGSTWAAAAVPTGTGLLQSAACASATRCLAVGTTSTTVSGVVPAAGALLLSDDGGHTWTPSPATPPVNNIFGVDCPLVKVCVMVGTRWVGGTAVGTGAVARSTDGGTTFIRSTTAYTPLTLTAVACPTDTTCLAVGGDTVARLTLPTIVTAPAPPHHGATR